MAYRKHWSAAALTEVTTTSNAAYSDMATLTIPASEQTASKDLFVFWNGAFGCDVNTSDVLFRVTVDGVAKTTANLEGWRTSPVDYTHTGGFFKITTAATPADIVIKIQFVSETNTVTTRSKNTRLAVIEAATSDVYVESLTRVTRNVATYVDGVTATFTPATSGNYIALLCGYIDTTPTFSGAGDIRLSDGTNTTATLGIIGYDPTNLVPFVIGWRRTSLAASSQTIKAQYQSKSGSVQMGLSEQRLLILREDAFDNVYPATALASDDAGTQATYTDTALTLTQTTNANDHLQIAAWFQEGTSSALTNYSQLVLDGSSVGEMQHTTIDASSDQSGHGVFMAQISAPGAASHTWKVQRKSETTSTFTTVKRNATIFVFDLGTAPAGGVTLTGASATSSAGTLAPATAKALSGQVVTASAGTLSPARTVALTGLGISSARGTLTPTAAMALTGQVATTGQGAVSAGGSVTAALTGLALSAGAGTLAPASSKAVSGQATTSASGSLVAFSSIALTGIAATGSAGSLGRAFSISLVGASTSSAQGALTALVTGNVTVALTGISFAAAAGVLVASNPITAPPLSPSSLTAPTLAGDALTASPLSASTLTAPPLGG